MSKLTNKNYNKKLKFPSLFIWSQYAHEMGWALISDELADGDKTIL